VDIFDEANSADTMLERALALYELGFHIIPLGCPFEDPPQRIIDRCGSLEEAKLQWPKTPRISWAKYQTECPTEDEVRGWWTKWPRANIAAITGAQFNVVDADTHEVADWCDSGAITRTPWKVRTGRGVQFYYKANELDVRNMANPESKLDMRGNGGYVVAPGSTHSSGKVYQFEIDESYNATTIDDLPELTSNDLNVIHGYTVVPPLTHNNTGFSIDARNVKVKSDGSPTTDGGRNDAAATKVGQMINAGMDVDTMWASLLEWNQSNLPPLAEGELLTTCQSVINTAMRNNPKLVIRQTPPPKNNEGADGLPPIYSVGQLIDKPLEKPESWWGGAAFFKGCRFMISAPPKSGKSRFVVNFAAALSMNKDFLGQPSGNRAHKTLWMNAEIHEAWLADRVSLIINNNEAELHLLRENFQMTGRLNLDITNPNDFNTIIKMIELSPPDVIIFDPFINFSSAEENSNSEMRAVLDRFDHLQARFGFAIVLVHHTKKASGKFDTNPFEGIRGASALRGWYDTCVALTPIEGQPGQVGVSWEMRNGEPFKPHGAQWDKKTGEFKRIEFAQDDETGTSSNTSAEKRYANEMHAWMGEPDRIRTVSTIDELKSVFSAVWDVKVRTVQRALVQLYPIPGIVKVEVDKKGNPTSIRRDF